MTSNTGPILVFPRIQPFGSDKRSSLGKVYSRQATESVESCISTKFNHSFLISLQQIFFLCRIIGQRYVCLHHTRHEQWDRLSCHNKSPCSIMASITFFTSIWDCSVNTELINRNNCAKNSFNRLSHRHRSVLTIFLHLCSWAFLLTMELVDRKTGLSAFTECYHHQLCDFVLFSLWFAIMSRIPLLFWSRSKKWPLSWWKSFCTNWNEMGA